MILIADSGSTKTIWKSTDRAGNTHTAYSSGINPYYNSQEEIWKEIRLARQQLSSLEFDEIYFYGAGCSTQNQKEVVKNGLSKYFRAREISVYTDLLGAARALFLKDPGIVCILGTGSGSCVYNGSEIVKSIPSLGFILGDEGSGASLGKQFIRDFLREEIPADLLGKSKKELNITKEEVLKNVNQEPMPSRYLAGFSKFIYENIEHPYMNQLVYNSFNEFTKEYIMRYENFRNYRIGFIGSIALRYQKILQDVLADRQILLSQVTENPVEGLLEYHHQKEYNNK